MWKQKLGAVLLCAVCCTAVAKDKIVVSEAYARPTVAGQTQGGAFLTIDNRTQQDNVLIGAELPAKIAKRTELHTHINENGVMKMREMKDGIALPKQSKVVLKPGGLHIMFFDLQKPLTVGKKIPLTLKFKHGKKQTAQLEVRPMDKTMPQHHHHHE